MTNMEKINSFYDEAGVFFLSTVDGDTPRCRPLGLHVMIDGTVYYGIGNFKEVYKQLLANPKAEIVAIKGPKWLRINGKAVFEPDYKIADQIMANSPLRKMYEDNGWKMQIFHLEEAKVEFIDMMTVSESFEI